MTSKSSWALSLFIALVLLCLSASADSTNDFREPIFLTGTIYSDASLKQVLFTFRRTATNFGSTINILREFNLPDGSLAAREHVVYERGQMKSFVLEDLQSGAKGSVISQSAEGETKLTFIYTQGATKKSGSEKLVKDTLINDMVGPFIAAHWDALVAGMTVKCRFVALSRAETVGFKFFKESETTRQGKPVVMIEMEPSSIIIARLVAPLHFIVEKGATHRVLQYSGRTTPSIRRSGKWEDVDAVTVFDWR